MKRFVLFLLVMATLAVTGCHNEEIADYRYGHKVIVTANKERFLEVKQVCNALKELMKENAVLADGPILLSEIFT